MRTPGQKASPKRKAETLSKLCLRADASCTPPKNKRPVRENDITPKSDKRFALFCFHFAKFAEMPNIVPRNFIGPQLFQKKYFVQILSVIHSR